jgi:hypothetical protein
MMTVPIIAEVRRWAINLGRFAIWKFIGAVQQNIDADCHAAQVSVILIGGGLQKYLVKKFCNREDDATREQIKICPCSRNDTYADLTSMHGYHP